MRVHKLVRTLLGVSVLLDALILFGLGAKIATYGVNGLFAWFRHVHFVPVSVANGEATFRLEPDYRFTAFYAITVLGTVGVTFFLLRLYLRDRNRFQ